MASAVEFLSERIRLNPAILNQPWAHDNERWAEFVFCVLDQIRRAEPESTRHVVSLAAALDLVSPGKLASLTADEEIVFRHILSRAGWDDEFAASAIKTLMDAARALMQAGGLHPILREEAATFHRQVCERFGEPGRSPLFQSAIGHWIQNTCNLPAPIDPAETERFARDAGFPIEDLMTAAEQLGISFALVDDLIREADVP